MERTLRDRLFPTLCLTLLALCLSGCWYAVAGGAAAGGTYGYIKGELRETLAASIATVGAATDKAVADLALHLERKTLDGVAGHYALLSADRTKIRIELKSLAPQTTKVSIRVGALGDRDLSSRILEAIRGNL